MAFAVEGIAATTDEPYELTELAVDSVQFVDRPDRLVDIPARLVGSWLIQTAKGDADEIAGDADFLRFWITRDASVYVAHDRRIADKPAWLADWSPRGEALLADEDGETRAYDLLFRDFAAGEVVLGSNVDEPADGSMYSVVVVEAAP